MTRDQERCAICGCQLHRSGEYATPTVAGRSHATEHHYVAERLFGHSANRHGIKRGGLFGVCPWGYERKTGVHCYECHEELPHNPVLLPDDVSAFARLDRTRGLLSHYGVQQERSGNRKRADPPRSALGPNRFGSKSVARILVAFW